MIDEKTGKLLDIINAIEDPLLKIRYLKLIEVETALLALEGWRGIVLNEIKEVKDEHGST